MSRYTKANHRVFMQLIRRDVWHVTFLEPGLQKPLPKTLTFKDEGKIRELARRGEAWQTFWSSNNSTRVPELSLQNRLSCCDLLPPICKRIITNALIERPVPYFHVPVVSPPTRK